MKTHLKTSLFVVMMLFGFCANAQPPTESERIQKAEEDRRNYQQKSIRAQLDSAIRLTERGSYELADEEYRYVLKNMKSVPSDLTFYFGKNSFMLQKYSQSVDWLNKYVQLKGTSGEHYDDAINWLRKAEAELLKERRVQSAEATVILSKNYDIDCGPTGKVTCPACSGSTVVIRKSYLGESYKTCPTCKKLGYLTCEEYNRLLRGELRSN
jgi:hypothetical protein